VDITGTFDTVQDLADAIGSKVAGMTATVSNGKLSLYAGDSITLAGAQTVSGGNAEFTTLTTAVNGDLRSVNVLDVESANDAILRVDATLTDVTNFRSTFGSIQNRFETVIANLSATAENLTASRSRIQDADFAAETAALTRAQILQQAGIAMLAQANALPNQVLQLLQR
jgi:flagellin